MKFVFLCLIIVIGIVVLRKHKKSSSEKAISQSDPPPSSSVNSEKPDSCREPVESKGRTLVKRNYRGYRVQEYSDNILKLATCTDEWKRTTAQLIADGLAGKKVFRYSFVNKPVKLIPDNSDPYDPDAIQIYIAGELVGYVCDDHKREVSHVLKQAEIKYISASITGGDYKIIKEDRRILRDSDIYRILLRIGYVI